MSPERKIQHDHHEPRKIYCKYCNETRCWKHGFYIRTGFYLKHSIITDTPQLIQRYICCNPQCRHTFSILPEDVVPYCRFHWKDLMEIAVLLFRGTSAYTLAHIWDLSLRVLCRVKALVYRLKESW